MKVIIIGNSAAGLSALEAFRKIDTVSKVWVVTKESPRPYSRVQLPYYLTDRVALDSLAIRPDNHLHELNAKIITGQVVGLDTAAKTVHLNTGQSLAYDRLLIASGSAPFTPAITGIGLPGVHNIWTMEDAVALKSVLIEGQRILIIGGGFIAMQAAWAAAQCNLETTLSVRSIIMRRDLDDIARATLKERMQAAGILLMEGTTPDRILETADNTLQVDFTGHDSLQVDTIVSATGIQPNTGFLEDSNLEIDGGILVNSNMQTNIQNIYAAGDVAAAKSAGGRQHQVQALWPCAVEQGQVAGQNLAGLDTTYQGSLNMNVVELFGLVIASVGRFTDTEGFDTWTWDDQKVGNYLRIFLDEGVPVGGISLGKAEGVGILGMLRPYIRYHRFLSADRPGDLAQALQLNLFPGSFRKPAL